MGATHMTDQVKIGDIVMFKPEGRYAKWFGGRLGVVEITTYNKAGDLYFRVRWLEPVQYFDGFAPISSFSADKFVVFDGGR
jgi:hypothetical protein